MTNNHQKIKKIRSGLALAALFGWLLSFPMFGRLLLDTSGEKALTFGLVFVSSHAVLFLGNHFFVRRVATLIQVRAAGMAISLLTVLYGFFYGHFIVDLFVFATLGFVSAYLVLAWATEFINDTRPLLNLGIAMAGANLLYALFSAPLLSPHVSSILLAMLSFAGAFLIQPSIKKETFPILNDLWQQSFKMMKALAAFVIAIYFVGGIWYQTVVMQISATGGWDALISALMYAAGILILAYLAVRTQPGNLALYSLSALGLGLLVNLSGLTGMLPTLAYHMALSFGLAAADLFFWFALWVLGRLYGGRRVFGLGLGFSLVFIALSVVVSTSNWLGSSPPLLYIMALTLLFLAVPFIFRYPFQLVDLSAVHLETSAGLSFDVADMLKPPENLTAQERQVYALLVQGATNDEIAEEMFISQHTVKFHARNTFRKIGVKNRKELRSRLLLKR
jgi:DNA-binding CsgD family transcriptional regulator